MRKRGGVDFVLVEFPLENNKYSETKNRPGIGRPVDRLSKVNFHHFNPYFFCTKKTHFSLRISRDLSRH